MFQRLKNAVSSAFEEKSSFPPSVPLHIPQGSTKQLVPSIATRHGQRSAPTIVACDSQIGLIASIVSGDQLVIYELRGQNDLDRSVIPIREDQTWIQAAFIPGTGLLALLSEPLLLLVDVDRALRAGCSDEAVCVSLYIRPSSTRATCMSVLTGTSLIAIGASDSKIRFAKFCGLSTENANNSRSSSSDMRLLMWSQYTADLFAFLKQENTPVFRAQSIDGDTVGDSSYIGPEECSVVCCEQYPNDPNALVAVLTNTMGITKFYAVENRLSAFFLLPVQYQQEPICACAVTPGGGFVVGQQRQRLCVWNEQSAKKKDRTVPTHFIVDLPFGSSVSREINTGFQHPQACGLWLAASEVPSATGKSPSSASLTALFVTPDLAANAICEVRFNCDTKTTEAIHEHPMEWTGEDADRRRAAGLQDDTSQVFYSMSPWTRSPWKAAWNLREDLATMLACTSRGLVVMSLGFGRPCRLTPIRFLPCLEVVDELSSSASSSSRSAFIQERLSFAQHVAPKSTCLPYCVALKQLNVFGKPLHVLQQRELYPDLRKEMNDFFGFRYHDSSVEGMVCVGPMFDVCAPVAVPPHIPQEYKGQLPRGWSRKGTRLHVVQALGTHNSSIRSLKVAVYTTPLTEESDSDNIQSVASLCLVCALIDVVQKRVISFTEAQVSLLPKEGRSQFADDINEVRVLCGSWQRSAVVMGGGGDPSAQMLSSQNNSFDDCSATMEQHGAVVFGHVATSISVVVVLRDGSYAFQNVTGDHRRQGAAPLIGPVVLLPSILFPASDAIHSFACVLGSLEKPVKISTAAHADPNSTNSTNASQPLPTVAYRQEPTLFLLGCTHRGNMMLIDVGRLQVLGMKPFVPSPAPYPSSTATPPSSSSHVVETATARLASTGNVNSFMPPPLIPKTIFPWNTAMPLSSIVQLPHNISIEVNITGLLHHTNDECIFDTTVGFSSVGCGDMKGSNTAPLEIVFSIRSFVPAPVAASAPPAVATTAVVAEDTQYCAVSTSAEEPVVGVVVETHSDVQSANVQSADVAQEDSSTKTVDDVTKSAPLIFLFTWEIMSWGEVVSAKQTAQLPNLDALPTSATASCVFTCDGRFWKASCRVEGDNCVEDRCVVESRGVNEGGSIAAPPSAFVNSPIASCSASITGADLVCVEVHSMPSGLAVCSFADMSELKSTAHKKSDETLKGAPVVVQLNPQQIIVYDDASILVNAVVPPLGPPKKDGKKSSTSGGGPLVTAGSSVIQLPEGHVIAQWILRSIVRRGRQAFVLVLISETEAEPGSLLLRVFDVTNIASLIADPVTLPLVFPFQEQDAAVRCDSEVFIVNDELHVYCFLQHRSSRVLETIHVLYSDAPEASISSVPAAIVATGTKGKAAPIAIAVQPSAVWPVSRGLPRRAARGSLCPHHVRTPLHLLPPAPSNASATQKEQGFFKRLIVSSRETLLEKLEALCSPTVKETYEDMLDRIIAPAEKKLGIDRKPPASAADERRRQLLGEKYSEQQHAGGRAGGTKNSMDETKQLMNENMQLLQERGDKIDRVENKSEMLANETAQFAELCRQLKEKERSRWF